MSLDKCKLAKRTEDHKKQKVQASLFHNPTKWMTTFLYFCKIFFFPIKVAGFEVPTGPHCNQTCLPSVANDASSCSAPPRELSCCLGRGSVDTCKASLQCGSWCVWSGPPTDGTLGHRRGRWVRQVAHYPAPPAPPCPSFSDPPPTTEMPWDAVPVTSLLTFHSFMNHNMNRTCLHIFTRKGSMATNLKTWVGDGKRLSPLTGT